MQMDDKDLLRMNKVLRHRLRNIASGFRNAITLLVHELEGKLEPGQQEYFPLLLNECDDLSKMTDRMSLLFDEIQPGAPEEVGRLLALLEAEHCAEYPGSPLEVICVEATRSLVVPDRNAFVVVVKELLRNAVAARPGLAVALTVTDANGRIIASVFDQGKGLAAGQEADIFHPFATFRPRTLGLGLAIARKFAGHIGGSVEVDATKGPGLCVVFEFPIASGDATAASGQAEQTHPELSP